MATRLRRQNGEASLSGNSYASGEDTSAIRTLSMCTIFHCRRYFVTLEVVSINATVALSGLGRAYLCESDDVATGVSDADFFGAVERGADWHDHFGSLHCGNDLLEIFDFYIEE